MAEPSSSGPSLTKMLAVFRDHPLYWLLFAVPVGIVLELAHAPAIWIFIVAGLAIIPLAGLMGRATENLAETMGAGLGGLLNATFGNAAELIIALMVLAKGPDFFPLVKASITGSIIGNVLLVLGLAMLMGGLKLERQHFNRTAASMGATLLAIAVIGLIMPSLFYYVFRAGASPTPSEQSNIAFLSEEISIVLAIVYVLSLIFSLKTHHHLFAGEEEELAKTGEGHEPEWSRRTSLLVLLIATAGVALMSEFLVGSIQEATQEIGLNQVFVGVIVVAIIGNAAEHSTAVLVAMKDKMDLAVNIAVGSSLQIALFVSPVLVLASLLMGHSPHNLDLHFTPMELIALIASVAILALVSQDGESHWLEGVMLLAVYGILGLAFYHLPEMAW